MINQLNFKEIESKYPLIKQSILVTVLIIYWCFGFYPFNLEMPIGVKKNSISYHTIEGLKFDRQGIGYTMASPEWLQSAIAKSELEITLNFKPKNIKQLGPARILTLSEDLNNRNLTVGQDGKDLVLRIRTPLTNLNGYPPYIINNILKEKEWNELRVSIRSNKLNIIVNGEPEVFAILPQNPLSDWSPNYRIALGNEFTLNRPWLGSIRHAIIGSGEAKIDYVEKENLYYPKDLTFNRANYHLIPFSSKSLSSNRIQDWVLNLFGFMPFGFLIIVISKKELPLFNAIAICTALSLSIEIGQLFLAGRVTSIDDLILNMAGGSVGAFAGIHFMNKNKSDPSKANIF